jgi:hypothetical protein
MMGYYARYPAILQQNLATLFPFLNDIKDHLAKTDPASPFSGAARGPARESTISIGAVYFEMLL